MKALLAVLGLSTLLAAAALADDAPATGAASAGGVPLASNPLTANPLSTMPLSRLSATRERPLFVPSRRPPASEAPPPPPPPRVVAAAPPPPATAEAPPFTLLGTVLTSGAKYAVLLNTSTNEVKRLKQGDAEAGWTAQKVDPRTAVLEKDGVANTLEMPKTTDAPAAPPPGDPAGAANNDN